MRIDLNAARMFVKVVESGSFTAAARVLGLPKSTVSDRVAGLEAQLGVALLLRTTRTQRLTDVGSVYFKEAQLALNQLNIAAERAAKTQERPTGALRITAPADLALHEFMEAVSLYRRKFPGVAVEFNFINADVDLIAEGYDIAIRGGRLTDSTMIARSLGASYMILVSSAAYLDHAPPLNHPQDLRRHHCMLMNVAALTRDRWNLRASNGRTARVHISVNATSANSFVALRSLASVGAGIALVPAALCKNELAAGSLIRALPEWATAKVPLYLVCPARQFPSPKVREFIPILEQTTRELFA